MALLSRNDDLEVDPETDSSGARFVTRRSVDAAWVSRKAMTTRRDWVEAVPVTEVARFTGHSTSVLMDLVRAGVLRQLPGRQKVALTAESLRVWMVHKAA